MKAGRGGRGDVKLSVEVGNRALERPKFPCEEIWGFQEFELDLIVENDAKVRAKKGQL